MSERDDDMVERVAKAMWAERVRFAKAGGIDVEEWGERSGRIKGREDVPAVSDINNIMGEARAAIEAIEQGLLALLPGKFSSLTLGYNESSAVNYMSVKEWQEEGPSDDLTDWVSNDEKAKAAATNSMWTLHWYPDTPVGSYCVGASGLLPLLAALNTTKGEGE